MICEVLRVGPAAVGTRLAAAESVETLTAEELPALVLNRVSGDVQADHTLERVRWLFHVDRFLHV